MNLMTTLVQLPFNWIKEHKKNLVNNLLGHISKLASTDTEMIKSTLELLKVIHYYFFIFFSLTTTSIQFLLNIHRQNAIHEV